MIIDTNQLWLFYPAVLALNLTPGNDMLFCLSQGMRSGPKAGMAASLGISAGSVVHVLLAALGLAALLAAHPLAFEVIRWAGVAYLVWLGIQTLLHFAPAVAEGAASRATLWQAFRQGLIVNLLNPKVVIFILAFLPQFVVPERGALFAQFVLLGLVFILNGTVVNGLVGLFAGQFGRLINSSPGFVRVFRYASALILFALAIRIAVN